MSCRIINFEISNFLYRRIKAYADFLCMNKNSLMQILVCIGVQEYYEGNIQQIKKAKIAKKNKKKLNEINLKKSALEIEMKYRTGDSRDDLVQKINYYKENEQIALKEKNTLLTRCKISIPLEIFIELNDILKVEKEKSIDKKQDKNSDRNLYKSDIICALIKYSLEKHLKYLEEIAPYELKIRDRRADEDKYYEKNTVKYSIERKISNEEQDKGKRRKIKMETVIEEIPEYIPLNEESYWREVEKHKLSVGVPELFYSFLKERADKYNIKPEDYIKILIEGEFSNSLHKDDKN